MTSILLNRTIQGPASARITIDGREYINFFGSGYLALSMIPEIREVALRMVQSGAAFARQVPSALGTLEAAFEDVEQAAATSSHTEAAIYFASGYFIGVGGLAALTDSYDVILLDEHAHYCLVDGARITGLPTYTFAHCDTDSLADTLKHCIQGRRRPLAVTDGTFATTGRIPPLAEYASVLAPYDGRIFVDESHSFGVVGNHGRGSAEYCGVERFATTGATLSKAYCAQGAFIGCSGADLPRIRALPSFRGACAGSPISAAVAAASLRYVAERPRLRGELSAMTEYLRTRLRGIGIDVIDSPAPIVSFRLGSRHDMQNIQRRVFSSGIYIYYSTYLGAGAEGTLRCAVFHDHSKADIDALVEAISG